MQIDSEFNQKLISINRLKKSKQLTEQQAQQQTNQAITQSMEKQ